MHLFVSLNKRDVDNKKAIQFKIVFSSSYRWLWSQFCKEGKHWGFLLAHEFSKYCLWWGKKLTSSDLFHLGATVLTTHITLCLSGVQCQQFEWSTMSTLVSWSSTQRPVNNRSQPMCHLPPSTLLLPSPLLQKSILPSNDFTIFFIFNFIKSARVLVPTHEWHHFTNSECSERNGTLNCVLDVDKVVAKVMNDINTTFYVQFRHFS